MIDNIKISKIWFDDDLIKLEIICSSKVITASTKIYTCNSLIDELIYKISQFLNGSAEEIEWSNGEKGDKYTECVSFNFLKKDNAGHIYIEVFMELNDGGSFSTHNCCFYVNTEYGLLSEFCDKLSDLKKNSTDVTIQLNEFGIL